MDSNKFSIERVMLYFLVSIIVIAISLVILISNQILFMSLLLFYSITLIFYFILTIIKNIRMSVHGSPTLHKLHKAEMDYTFKSVIIPIYEPPSSIHPALAGFLIDKKVGRREYLATLFNAIISGFIAIDERYENNDYKYYFIKNLPINSTNVCDRLVCDCLFDNGDKNLDSIAMASININADVLSQFVFDESIKLKYFANPYFVSKQYLKLKNDPIGFEEEWLKSIDRSKFWPLIFSLGSETEMHKNEAERDKNKVRDLMKNIKKRPISEPNDALKYNGLFYSKIGACERAKWLGFKDYLQTAERFRMNEEQVETFSKYLPYAVALGVETEWTKRFENMDIKRLEWFRSLRDETIRRHDNHAIRYEHLIRFMGQIHSIN